MATLLNTVLWLASVACLWGYFYRVVLRRPFAMVAKHLGVVLGLHMLLSLLAIGLSSLDLTTLPRPQHPPLWLKSVLTVFVKLYLTVLLVFLLNFMTAFAKQMMAKIILFHQTHNAHNLHKQPLRGLIQHQAHIVAFYQGLFMLGGAMMLWAAWFKTVI